GLILISGAARSAPPEEIRRVALEEVLSLGTLDDGALVQWTGIAADASGAIYVLDALDYALKKFDAAGRLLKKAGRQGQGPGEFLAPRVLALTAGRIYVLDQSRLGILVFDSELRYKKTIPFPRLLSMITTVGPGRLAVSGLTPLGQAARISLLDAEGRVLSEFSFLDKVDFFLADSISVAATGGGGLYLAYFFQDRVEKREANGKLVWSWSLAGPSAVETEKIGAGGRELLIPRKTFYKSAAVDRQGHLLVLCGGQTRHPSQDVYVFDSAGVRQAVFVLPEPSHGIYVDDSGFLYARANEGLTVKKYRVLYR
ncbi:MAG: 6-bladed beta-propeller, partial [Candidatus Aminicenantales bacterium]